MSHFTCRQKALPPAIDLALGVALYLLWGTVAVAQNNLGELLDAGARKLSVEEFKDQIVERYVVGPTPTGAVVELMYATNGLIEGTGTYRPSQPGIFQATRLTGDWTLDDEKVCTSMRIGSAKGQGVSAPQSFPPRCQFWFKYGEEYFLADSDSDRSVRVLRRTLKR